MTFSDYVAGRSVALVGPAAPLTDQSAEIDGHDLVARVNFTTFRPAEYGTRCDIAYLNGGLGRTALEDGADWAANDATWWVYKQPNQHRPDGLSRRAVKAPIPNPHAIPMALYDLIMMGAETITVYGSDLYAAGPGQHYHPDYPNGHLHTDRQLAEAIRLHRPQDQRRLLRWCNASGRVVGDDRYLAAVNMSDDEYRKVLDRWAALEEAP